MRRRTYATVAVAGSLALGAGVLAAPSSAYTKKELNVCWANTAKGVLDLEFVADGPSYKTFSLDHGDCSAWDVRPGQYKLTVEDVDEFVSGMAAECGVKSPSLKIRVKRMNDAYKAYPLAALLNGSITTNVKKDRRTSVLVHFKCV